MPVDSWNKLQEHIQKNQNGIETAVLLLLDLHFSLPEESEIRKKTKHAIMTITKKDPEVIRDLARRHKGTSAPAEVKSV